MVGARHLLRRGGRRGQCLVQGGLRGSPAVSDRVVLVHHFVSYADLHDAGQDGIGRDVPLGEPCLPLCGDSQPLF